MTAPATDVAHIRDIVSIEPAARADSPVAESAGFTQFTRDTAQQLLADVVSDLAHRDAALDAFAALNDIDPDGVLNAVLVDVVDAVARIPEAADFHEMAVSLDFLDGLRVARRRLRWEILARCCALIHPDAPAAGRASPRRSLNV